MFCLLALTAFARLTPRSYQKLTNVVTSSISEFLLLTITDFWVQIQSLNSFASEKCDTLFFHEVETLASSTFYLWLQAPPKAIVFLQDYRN